MGSTDPLLGDGKLLQGTTGNTCTDIHSHTAPWGVQIHSSGMGSYSRVPQVILYRYTQPHSTMGSTNPLLGDGELLQGTTGNTSTDIHSHTAPWGVQIHSSGMGSYSRVPQVIPLQSTDIYNYPEVYYMYRI